MLPRLLLFFGAVLLFWTMLLSAAPAGLGFIPRADWLGDPYMLTNPPGNALSPFRVSLVLNPELTTNLVYQAKVNTLVAAMALDQKNEWADIAQATTVSLQARKRGEQIIRTAGTVLFPTRSAAPSAGTLPVPKITESSAATNTTTDHGSWLWLVQRWATFCLVVLFLIRRLWRYFREVEEDDDFADHLATLAVAHRWVFPVYMVLLIAVAGAEFFQIGNLLFSLSLLMLASSLRRYYCEGDFADFPKAQKVHLAMRLALVGLGWIQGYDNYLTDLGTWGYLGSIFSERPDWWWYHFHVFIWVFLAWATIIFSRFYNNADLAEHRNELYFFLTGFLVFGLLGGTAGYHFLPSLLNFRPWQGLLVGGISACLPLGVHFYRWNKQVSAEIVGRTLFDMIFSHGDFSEKTRKKKHVPEVLLLRHWRDHGEGEKAWQTAQSHLFNEARALPVWLFALETAVLYRRQPGEALEILKRLCVAEEFHYDHRTVAVAQVQGWMAAAGFKFDAAPFKLEQAPLQPTVLTNQVEQKCREGRFGEAVLLLREALEKDSQNEQAFTQLVRLYCQDLKNRPAAEKLIADANETFSPKLLDFLRRSLDEWMRLPIRSTATAKPRRFLGRLRGQEADEPATQKISIISPPISQSPAPPEAADPLTAYLERVKEAQGKPPDTSLVHDRVEKLLLERRLGTAIEIIKQEAEAQPENFDLWLRYAEAHGHHCGDLNTAEKIIRLMDRSGHFKKAQMKKVLGRMKKWRKQHPTAQNNW